MRVNASAATTRHAPQRAQPRTSLRLPAPGERLLVNFLAENRNILYAFFFRQLFFGPRANQLAVLVIGCPDFCQKTFFAVTMENDFGVCARRSLRGLVGQHHSELLPSSVLNINTVRYCDNLVFPCRK